MNIFLIIYFTIGIVFGWKFFFKEVWAPTRFQRRESPEIADILFYLLLIFIWPYPLIDTTVHVIHVIRSRRK